MNNNIIDIKQANCQSISLLSNVQFEQLKGENGESKTAKRFKIEAYTGQVIDRWWGKLAIDISGMKAKTKMPILLNHDVNQIVGHSDHVYMTDSFFVDGKFSSSTEQSKYVQALAGEGFPWQASIGVKPLQIRSLAKDEVMLVNGQEINGQAEIWLQSEVFETSFVPLGADNNTSIQTFSRIEERENINNIMNKDIKMETKEIVELASKNAEEMKRVKIEMLESHKTEIARIMELAKLHFGAKGSQFVELAESGITVEQFQKVQAITQPKQEETNDQKREDLKKQILEELKKNQIDVGVGGQADRTPKTFQDAWQMLKEEKKLSTEHAMQLAARTYPELYIKMTKGEK